MILARMAEGGAPGAIRISIGDNGRVPVCVGSGHGGG